MKHPFIRYDEFGKITLMVYAEGYVMCRRPGAAPMLKSWADWQKLSRTTLDPAQKAEIEAYQSRGKAKALTKKAARQLAEACPP